MNITQHKTDVLFVNWERDDKERQNLIDILRKLDIKSSIAQQLYLINRSLYDNVSSRPGGKN